MGKPIVEQETGGTVDDDVTQGSSSGTDKENLKPRKETAIAEVRGIRISLSTDSQGRDLPLIPPWSDGFGTQNPLSVQGEMFTLPQSQSDEDRWYQAGPVFQQYQHASTLMIIHSTQASFCHVSQVLDLSVQIGTSLQTFINHLIRVKIRKNIFPLCRISSEIVETEKR